MSENNLKFELVFWLQIMGDHARFIKDSLSAGSDSLQMIAADFIRLFDRLYDKAGQDNELKPCGNLVNEITNGVISFREFKRELLSDRLRNLQVTKLTPTFYNHMLNELERFLAVLTIGTPEGLTKENVLGEHLLWTSDAAGHAAALAGDLDKVEYGLRTEAECFLNRFDEFYLKAVEITGYYRSNPPAVQPVLEAFNFKIVKAMQDFMGYLTELKEKLIKGQVLSGLSPLIPDHMYREECYYLHKIAIYQPGIPKPDCDPGRPRVEERQTKGV